MGSLQVVFGNGAKGRYRGSPRWWFEETGLAEPRNSLKRRTTIAALTNLDYSGYDISTNLGGKQDVLDYEDEFRFLDSFDN